MWRRITEHLCCPVCKGSLELDAFREESAAINDEHAELAASLGIAADELTQRVDAGALICAECKYLYPVYNGLPILLTYTASVHREFERDMRSPVRKLLDAGLHFPDRVPEKGERFVLESFSKEWRDYEYDGVIWEMDYADHEARFLKEIGEQPGAGKYRRFLEIGCGLGITTDMAQTNFKVDAFGMDLGFAAMKATAQFADNPFLHFVQASVYALPFPDATFDLVYSHGVLHHTWSTEEAFSAVAGVCAPGGKFYLWVYGPGSINETAFRRAAYAAESVLRPVLSKNPSSLFAKAMLGGISVPYVLLNRFRRAADPTIQPLTMSRAIHAARDRFTPEFAHRQSHEEVIGWFRQEGYQDVEAVNWRDMPSADHDDFRRNVGVRGIRGQS